MGKCVDEERKTRKQNRGYGKLSPVTTKFITERIVVKMFVCMSASWVIFTLLFSVLLKFLNLNTHFIIRKTIKTL